MSQVLQVGPHWNYEKIRKLFIFGDSYSAVGHNRYTLPTPAQPLGMPFPGITYNESSLPNWVGHYLLSFCNHPRFPYPPDHPDLEAYAVANAAWSAQPLLVHDYAFGGATCDGVRHQTEAFLLSNSDSQWPSWNTQEALFITQVGINDCGFSADPEASMAVIQQQHEKLYEAGARNFLFMDVPRIDSSPAFKRISIATAFKTLPIVRLLTGVRTASSEIKGKVAHWNAVLHGMAAEFSAAHPDATVLLFSLASLFTRVLEERTVRDGQIWYDHIHPTSKVHEIMASNLADFLSKVPLLVPEAGVHEGA